MNLGWISLHRKIMDHQFYQEKRVFSKFEAWISILMDVNHAEQKVLIKGVLMICKTGESLNSMVTWSKKWGWGDQKVKRYFEMLKKDGMICLESDRKTTRLSVCNYSDYQDGQRRDNEPATNPQRTSNEPATTNNNTNNTNNINNDNNKNKKSEQALKSAQTKAFNIESEKYIPYIETRNDNNNIGTRALTKRQWLACRRGGYDAKTLQEFYNSYLDDCDRKSQFSKQFGKMATLDNLKEYSKANANVEVEKEDLVAAEELF